MPTDNNRSNQDENLSSSFSQFSQSLGRSSQALLDASKKFENIFNDFINDFEDITNESNNSSRSNGNQMTSNMSKMFERSDKNMKNAMTMGQKISSTLITSLSVIGGRVVKEFETAFDNVYNKYKSSFSNITVRMGMSHKEYQDMWNAASASFQSQGLNKQFSPVDFADALESVLSTGLRGDIAEQKAMHDLVSQKLVPAISTNTIAYRRMTKEFGTSIQDHVTAIAKYTEQVYGAEGIDEGKFDQMYSTLEAQIRYAAGGDQEKAQQAIDALTAQMAVLEKNNIDSDTYIQELYNAFTGEIGTNSPMSSMWGSFTPDKAIEAMMSGDTIAQYVNAYSNNGATASNADYLNAYTSAMGGNMQTGYEVGAFIRGGGSAEDLQKQMDDLLNGFDADAVITKETKRLQDGFYQNVDDQLTKIEENTMTGPAVFAAEIPRFKELASDVKAILSAVVRNFLFTKTLGKSGGLSNLSTTITGGIGQGTSVFQTGAKNTWNSLWSSGTRAANKAAGIGSEGLTAGTAIAGVGMIAGGLINGGIDAGSAASNALDNGATAGQAVGQGFYGFFSGDTSGAVTQSQKIDRVKEKGMIDWKAVGSAATTGGLIGAGTGTLVGGAAGGIGAAPGAAIGAAIGAATGALTSLTTQAIKYKDTQDYLESSFYKLGENVSKSSQYFSDFAKNTNNYKAALDKVRSGQNELADLEGELVTTHGDEKDAIEQKIKQLKIENSIAASEAIMQASQIGSADEVMGQINNAQNIMDQAQAAYDFYTTLENANNGDIKDLGLDKTKISDIEGGRLKKLYGLEFDEDLEGFIRNAIDAGIIKDKKVDFDDKDTLFDALRAITVDRYSEITGIDNVKGSDYDSWKENGSVTDWAGPQMALSQKKTYQEAKSMVSSIPQSANLDILNDDDLAVYDNAMGRAQVTAALAPLVISPDLNSEGKNPKSFLEDQFGSVYKYLVTRGVNAKSAQNYSDYINSVEDPVVEGWYKTGSRFVARDQIAQLHAGEMVLTASNAEALRQIDANGLQGALSTMKEIASASPVEDTTTQTAMSNLIVASINSQTETLGNYLMTIVGYLSRLSPASSVNADNTAQLSEALLTYAGV